MAVVAAIVLHMLLLALAAMASAWVAFRGSSALLPAEPLIIAVIALVAAQCSLGAIWWSRTSWPAHWKTLAGIVVCADLWVLLMATLDSVHREPIAAACWAAALAVQIGLTALASSCVEFGFRNTSAARRQFSILYLLIWTTVIAVLLGTARRVIDLNGWTFTEAVNWQFAQQLMWSGVVNAVLAAGLLAGARLPVSWRTRAGVCVVMLCVVTISAPLLTLVWFDSSSASAGASIADLAWLWFAEGLFLLAALIPLELAGGDLKTDG